MVSSAGKTVTSYLRGRSNWGQRRENWWAKADNKFCFVSVSKILWLYLLPASSPPRDVKTKRPSPWFSTGNRRTDSEGKDDKRSEVPRKTSDHNDSRTNQGNGNKQHSRQDPRQRSGSKNQQQSKQSQPGNRSRGNSTNQFRPSSGSLSANWRERSQAQSESTAKDKVKENERSTDKLTRGEDDKERRKEEKGKVNGEAKDEKLSSPASDEKPAETNMVKSKTIEAKEEGTA